MVIDERGKLFGRVSIIDIAVILVILTALAGAYYKFFIAAPGAAAQYDVLQFQVKTEEGVRQPTVDAVEVGAEVFDLKTNNYLGKVVDKQADPATDYIEKTDGTSVAAQKPGMYDLIVTIEVSGVETDRGYFTKGNQEIKRGSKLSLKTRLVEFKSEIVNVEKVPVKNGI